MPLSPTRWPVEKQRLAFFSTVEKIDVREFDRCQFGLCRLWLRLFRFSRGQGAEGMERVPISAKSSPELVRQQNSSLVLSALRRHGRMAHTQISDATGLASATISAITADLERAGVIERSESLSVAGRGRPRVLFSQCRDYGYLALLVIASDNIEYSLVDYAGTLLDRFVEPRGAGGPEAFLTQVSVALRRLLTRSRIGHEQLLLVSVSSKGLVDPQRPVLVWSPVFGAQSVDFSRAMEPGWRVLLNNETLLVAGALLDRGEKRLATEVAPFRAGERRLAALSLGHSIGLGIARASVLGITEILAPNFGHMLHAADGGLCRCGARGCVEAYAGFYAILRSAFEVPADTVPAKFVPIAEVDKLAVRARQGGRQAVRAFRQAGLALGNGLSRLISLHGPMPVFITGLGSRYYDLLDAGLRDGLAESHVVRLGGMPQLTVVADEPSLVFEGHLSCAFAVVDQGIVDLAG